MNINRAEISGNLTRDADVRQTQGGINVISFGVAVNDRRQNPQTGQWEDVPNFVDCVMFDRNGTKQWMVNDLRKGFKVFVAGSLRYSSWEDRETGKNRSKLEVVVRDIDANWSRKDQAPQGYAPQQPTQAYPQQQAYQTQGYQQAPRGYRQQRQGYGQPVSAPQAPQAATYQQPQQYTPQQPPQQPAAPPQQAPQQMQMQPQPVTDVYDEDIPF